jgi:hypothetical protein
LPYLLVFLCPVLHLLHDGHGHHDSHHAHTERDKS